MNGTNITLRNIKPSAVLTRRIRAKCEALERFHPEILHCRVSLERETPKAGPVGPFIVTLRVAVPGEEIVVNHVRHADAHLALRDAFSAARRRLKDAASVQRGEVKPHSRPTMEATP